jgi:hypothetical protein
MGGRRKRRKKRGSRDMGPGAWGVGGCLNPREGPSALNDVGGILCILLFTGDVRV